METENEETLWSNIQDIEIFESLYDDFLNQKLVTIPITSASPDRIKNIKVNFVNGTKINYNRRSTRKFMEEFSKDEFRNRISRIDIKFDFSKVKFDSYVLACALNEKWD